MKIFYTILFVAISLLNFSQEDKWHPCKCKNEMNVRFAVVDPVNFKVSFKTEIKANIDDIIAVVKDIPSYTDWLYNLETIEVLDYEGEGDGLCRTIVNAPFPLLDIEMFLQWEIIEKEDEFIVIQTCIPYYRPYDERYQRVTRYKAVWHLKPLSNDKVRFSYLVKMGGPKNLPRFLLKMYLCDAPTASFKEFKKICENK